MFSNAISIGLKSFCLFLFVSTAGFGQKEGWALSTAERTVADLSELSVMASILNYDTNEKRDVVLSATRAIVPHEDGTGEVVLDFNGIAQLTVRLQAQRHPKNGSVRVVSEVAAKGDAPISARLERLSLVLPLHLQNRKRVLQAGEDGMTWETRFTYQFHTPMNKKNTMLQEPETNVWRIFRSDWSAGDTYTLARWESEHTAPLVVHRGTGFPGWFAIYDRKGGVAVGLDEAIFRTERALEARPEGGGNIIIDLHPSSAAPRPLNEANMWYQDSLAVKISPFDGTPDAMAKRVGRLAAVSGPPKARASMIEPSASLPITGGVPLAANTLKAEDAVAVLDFQGQPVPLQTSPLAFWPDGSVKWLELIFPRKTKAMRMPKTSGKLAEFDVTYGSGRTETYSLMRLPGQKPKQVEQGALSVSNEGGDVRVRTGRLEAVLGHGINWWRTLSVDGQTLLRPENNVRAYLDMTTLETPPEPGALRLEGGKRESSSLTATNVKVEESGPVRAVVRIEGRTNGSVPCTIIIRLEFYADSPVIRGWHTFVVGDFDPRRVFITGLGMEMPLAFDSRAARAIFENDGKPVRVEAPNAILCSRHPDSIELTASQQGKARKLLSVGPQLTGGMTVQTGRLGVSAVLRDFRKLYPSGLAIRSGTDGPALDIGFWPRDAEAMDLRRYSDFPHRAQGETVTTPTNDWVEKIHYREEPVRGISRTHEFLLALDTGKNESLSALATALDDRPLIYSGEKNYLETGVLADDLTGPSLTPARATLERFASFLEFHRNKWRWSGKWVYGDIQHSLQRGYGRVVEPAALADVLEKKQQTLPPDVTIGDYRTQNDWAFDNGRWGWTNTEGLPNRFLAEQYLRTGNRDVFFAMEAMARHSRDVVIRHEGRWLGMGTRHGVQPWSDGCHQERMTIPSEYRLHRLLTGEKRSRDVLLRYGYDFFLQPKPSNSPYVRENADHSARLYGVLTLWEATGDPKVGNALARYVSLFIVPQGIATEPSVKFPEIVSVRTPGGINSGNMFFQTFGAMNALVEYHALTSDEPLRKAIVRMANAALDTPAVNRLLAENAPNSAYFFWPALSFAARYGGEESARFRDFISAWAAGPGAVALRQIITENPKHWTGPTAFMFGGGGMSATLFRINALPALAVSLGALPEVESAHRARLQDREREGNPRPPANLSWQDEYDRPEFQSFLGRWLPPFESENNKSVSSN